MNRARNCRKHFPDRKRLPNYRWSPDYRTADGASYTVPDVVIDECPVSFIRPESREMLLRHQRAARAWDARGIQAYPPGEVLARDIDILMVIESEQSRLNEAADEAERMAIPKASGADG